MTVDVFGYVWLLFVSDMVVYKMSVIDYFIYLLIHIG